MNPVNQLSFDLSEEHLAVQGAARDFARHQLFPGVIERDNEQKFDPELRRRLELDDASELQVVGEQLREIALLRIGAQFEGARV